MTLKEDILAAQAKAVALHCEGQVPAAFVALLAAVNQHITDAKGDIYNASADNVKALIEDLRAVGGW